MSRGKARRIGKSPQMWILASISILAVIVSPHVASEMNPPCCSTEEQRMEDDRRNAREDGQV